MLFLLTLWSVMMAFSLLLSLLLLLATDADAGALDGRTCIPRLPATT
jgi:hypothetical protein